MLTSVDNTSTSPSVVLTFDDGPSKVLDDLLDILKAASVPAVFFWQTRLLYPNRPWKRVLDEGHLIGSHGIKHANLVKFTLEEQLHEIATSKQIIESITGTPVQYFRPPFGQFNEDTLTAVKQLDLTLVMWRVASMDWELKGHPEAIIDNIMDHLEDGAILLLHELKQTVTILPELIRRIKQAGYTFTTL